MIRITAFLLMLNLCLGLLPAWADLAIPDEAIAPSDTQLQKPSAADTVPGETAAVALTATSAKPAAAQARIEGLLRTLLGKSATVVLVPVTPEGQTKSTAKPASPRYTVQVSIAEPRSSTFGSDYTPVTLTVVDAVGKKLGDAQLSYREKAVAEFQQSAGDFLVKHLPLSTFETTAEKVKPARPRIHAWIESSTGDSNNLRIGSQIAFHFQSSVKGYVSLYHFSSSGGVQRIYPTERDPYNFVTAGQSYRYPKSGYMKLQGPAGEETFKAILTILPSNTPRTQPDGLRFKQDPLQVIPTHYPILFANQHLSRFFALPPHLFAETHIRYTLKPQ